jgi:hypothetical protein
MPPVHTFTFSSVLNAAPEQVWERVSTLSGVNAEMGPWFRMTSPRGLDRLEPAQITFGQPMFRSWLLLLGCCRWSSMT